VQRDLLDNLLHQFRNPQRLCGRLATFSRASYQGMLTAVADNIVRESDRLQELLQQFDQVIELTTI